MPWIDVTVMLKFGTNLERGFEILWRNLKAMKRFQQVELKLLRFEQ